MTLLTLEPISKIANSPNYKWWVYCAVAIGMFTSVMDQSGTNIALPAIADYFLLDIPTVQWVTLSYILATSALFMPAGSLSDIVGRKYVFMGGLAIGSFLAGRWAHGISRPVRAYAYLELFIGVYALVFPLLIKLVTPLYLGFWHAFEPSTTVFGIFQFLLLGLFQISYYLSSFLGVFLPAAGSLSLSSAAALSFSAC